MILFSYLKKIVLITLINLAIVAGFTLVNNSFSVQSVGKGMLYMGIIMFFFFVFSLTGAGSLSKGDARSHFVRSAVGGDFNKMAGEYSKRSNVKTNNVVALFCSSLLCGIIWLLLTKLS